MIIEHLKNKLELLNKRRHFHPIEIIKFIRSKVSFAKILKLMDDTEVKNMDNTNEVALLNNRIQ